MTTKAGGPRERAQPRWRPTFRGKRLRRLQARLLLWFLGAIVLAIGASILTTVLTASDNDTPTRVVSKHVQHRLARTWDDPVATDKYVAELRETTGLDMRVRRDPSLFAGRPVRGGSGMIFEDGVAYVPVVKGGAVVGALELRTGTQAPQLWRVGVALGAALLVLGAAARRVSKRLARPLEHLAQTAERFGSGDLTARTGIEGLPKRWVAEEVRDVGRAFDGMADRIARVVLEQRELLAAISHELRSPLGRARIAVEIARERPDPDARPSTTSNGSSSRSTRSSAICSRPRAPASRTSTSRSSSSCRGSARASPPRTSGPIELVVADGRRERAGDHRRGAPRPRAPQPVRERLESRPSEGRGPRGDRVGRGRSRARRGSRSWARVQRGRPAAGVRAVRDGRRFGAVARARTAWGWGCPSYGASSRRTAGRLRP